MTKPNDVSRRVFIATLAAAPAAVSAANKDIPIGLELYSVRDELKKNEMGTLDRVAKMGYECVEFFSPYYDWTPDYAKQIRSKIDALNLRCYSTHNGKQSFTPEGIDKAIQLNKILGARYIVMAHPGQVSGGIGAWKQIADLLNQANARMSKDGLHVGYHNHDLEWKPVDGEKPLQVLAENTDKSIMLQLDVGTCLETGNDPVAWIDSHPGRIRSMHLKDWSPQKGYRVLFGEGVADWKKIFAAAEGTGGVEYYLIEQEGSDYPEFETADRCLVAYKHIHG